MRSELRRLKEENHAMEIHAPHQEETCFHIEKLRNERRDVQRQIKELRSELGMLTTELDKKREEISEVRDRQAPSGVLVRCEQEVARLKAEVNKLTQSRLQSERDISQNERRLERLRSALGNFMKADKSIKFDPLPADTTGLGTKLAEYVVGLVNDAGEQEQLHEAREAKLKELQFEVKAAANDLMALVHKRGKVQRKFPSLGSPQAAPAEDTADGVFMTDGGGLTKAGEVQKEMREALQRNAGKVMDYFKEWDTDGSGSVSKKEFRRAWTALGIRVEATESDALFDAFDPSGDGAIDYKELNKLLRRREKVVPKKGPLPGQEKKGKPAKVVMSGKEFAQKKLAAKQTSSLLRNVDLDEDSGVPYSVQLRQHLQKNAVRVIDLFREWDADASGTVSKQEFADNMKLLGLNVPQSAVYEVFDSMDPDRSGEIEYQELNKLLRADTVVGGKSGADLAKERVKAMKKVRHRAPAAHADARPGPPRPPAALHPSLAIPPDGSRCRAAPT